MASSEEVATAGRLVASWASRNGTALETVWTVLAAHFVERHGYPLPSRCAVTLGETQTVHDLTFERGTSLRRSLEGVHPTSDPNSVAELQLGRGDATPVPSAKWRLSLEPDVRFVVLDGNVPLSTHVDEAFQRFVINALAAPDAPLDDCPLLSEPEKERVLAWGAGRESPFPASVQARVTDYPALLEASVTDERGARTWRQLWKSASQLAHGLTRHEIGPGSTVGLRLRRTSDYLVGILAAWQCGAAFAPLDPDYPEPWLEHMVSDAVCGIVLLDDASPAHHAGLGHKLSQVAGDRELETPYAPRPHDVAYVLFTSGSSGLPKGVEVTHGNLANLLQSFADILALAPDETVLSLTSFSFDISILELFLPLWTGVPLVIASEAERDDPSRLAPLVHQHDVRVVQATPTVWRTVLADALADRRLRRLVGGEAFPADLASQLLELPGEVWNLYGPTETTIWSTSVQVTRGAIAGSTVSLGQPVANTTLRVIDERGRLVPAGCQGELAIGGAGVARGYRRRPELTAARFIDDPGAGGQRIYRTGDMVRVLSDGTIEFLGRRDAQVKVRGHRIELESVEAALRDLPGVGECVAKVLGTAAGGILVGYVVPNGPFDATLARRHLGQRLPEYMVPTFLECIDHIPMTPNRKTDRSALPAPRALDTSGLSPREVRIAAAASASFGVLGVAVDDDFTDLGGFSLARFTLLKRLRDGGDEVTLDLLYRHPTVRALATALEARAAAAPDETTGDELEATALQERMFLEIEAHPEETRWQACSLFHLADDVSLEQLREALRRGVERHPDILSSFHLGSDGRVLRRLHAPSELSWEDLDVEPPLDGEDFVETRLAPLQQRLLLTRLPLDQPPMKFFAVQSSAGNFVLWLGSEIVIDAWSNSVFLQEVEVLCREPSAVDLPAPIPLSRHVQRERRNALALGPARDARTSPALATPLQKLAARTGASIGPRFDTTAKQMHPIEIPPGLLTTGDRLGMSVPLFIQAAWSAALVAEGVAPLLAGPRQVVYGMHVMNRELDEETGVGLYTGLVPVHVDVDLTGTVEAHLLKVKRASRDALRFETVGATRPLLDLPEEVRSLAWNVRFNHHDESGQPPPGRLPSDHRQVLDNPMPPLFSLGVAFELLALVLPEFQCLIGSFDAAVVPEDTGSRILARTAGVLEELATAAPTDKLQDLAALRDPFGSPA